jgi:hypothetical protein
MTVRNDFQKLKRKAFSAAEKGFSRRRANFKAWGKLDPTDAKPEPAKLIERPQSQDDQLQYVIRLLRGDETLARKIMSLQQKFPDGTTPELVVMEYLDRKQIKYMYQPYIFGGKASGKGVPDFALQQGPFWNIWEIEGNYWHSAKFETKEDQRVQQRRLLNHYFNGLKVQYWCQLWEEDIYNRRDFVMEQAVRGIALRPI